MEDFEKDFKEIADKFAVPSMVLADFPSIKFMPLQHEKPKVRLLCGLVNMRTGDCTDWNGYIGEIPYCFEATLPLDTFVLQKQYRYRESLFYNANVYDL